MTAFYDELAEVARALLAEFGPVEGFTSRATTGTFDKVRGGFTSTQTREQVLTGVRVPVNQTVIDQLDIRQSGETLQASEVIMLKVAASNLEFDLALGHIVIVEEREMPIVAMTKVRPADVTLLYTVALKK